MLTPEQLETLPLNITDLYGRLEAFIIQDFCRRLRQAGEMTTTAEWNAIKAREIGISIADIKKQMRLLTKFTEEEIENMFNESALLSVNQENKIYKKAGLTPIKIKENKTLQKFLFEAIKQTRGELSNITNSMGFASTTSGKVVYKPIAKYYHDALDFAQFQIASGTTDYNTAIRTAVKQLSNSGLRFINYENGWSNMVDVAVRRAIMTGANQMTTYMTDYTHDKLVNKDEQYVEVTAHSGARPSHAEWQGKVFKVVGSSPGYPNLVLSTGLGTGGGLKGHNCRHSYYPFIPGASTKTYTDKELNNIDPKPFNYKGKEYDSYQATQQMRKMETSIRQTKRELMGYKEVGLKDDFTTLSIKLQQQRKEYERFCKAAEIKPKDYRIEVVGFDKSISQESVWANKK
jgi:hypothetical protein